MSINQNVRSQPTLANPSGLYSDLLQISRTFTGAAVPDATNPSDAIVGNMYVDTSTAIEYVKKIDGSWSPILDFTTLPGIGVSDPLNIGTVNASQLNTDLIAGKASEDIGIDLKTTGSLSITGGATNGIRMNAGGSDNTVINNNGIGIFKSGVTGYEVYADNFAGEQVSIVTVPNKKVACVGTGDLTIENTGGNIIINPITSLELSGNIDMLTGGTINDSAGLTSNAGVPLAFINQSAGQPVIISANGAEVQTSGNLNVQSNDIVNSANISGSTVTLNSLSGDLTLKAEGTSNVSIKNVINQEIAKFEGNTGNFKMTVSNPVSSNSIAIDGNGSIEKLGTAELNITHNDPLGNIVLQTSGGGGIIRMSDGIGNIFFDALNERGTIDKIVTTDINNSQALSQYRDLSVNDAGVLDFRKPSMSVQWLIQNAGSNGVFFGEIGATSSPADYSGILIGTSVRYITEFSARINHNAPFSYGGGTSVLEIGYVPATFPAIAANFFTSVALNIPTGSTTYIANSGDLNIGVPANAGLVCRLTNTGTASTSNTMDMSVSVILH